MQMVATGRRRNISDFIWDFGKLPFPSHLGKCIIKMGKLIPKFMKLGK